MKWKLEPVHTSGTVKFRTVAECSYFQLQESRLGARKARIISQSAFGTYIICTSDSLADLEEAWLSCNDFKPPFALSKDNFLPSLKNHLASSILHTPRSVTSSSCPASRSESPLPVFGEQPHNSSRSTSSGSGEHFTLGYNSGSASVSEAEDTNGETAADAQTPRERTALSVPPLPLRIPVELYTPPRLIISQEDVPQTAPPYHHKLSVVRGRASRTSVKYSKPAEIDNSQLRDVASRLSMGSDDPIDEPPRNQAVSDDMNSASFLLPWVVVLYTLFLRFCPSEVFVMALVITSILLWRFFIPSNMNYILASRA